MTTRNKKRKLDAEEREILEAFNKGSLKSDLDDRTALEPVIKAAGKTLRKIRRINIRLNERDLENIKRKAEETGIPYQTLIGALLHQYAQGKIDARL